MIADTGGYARRDLCGRDFYDTVTELRALAGRHRDTHIGQKDAVCTQDLAELRFMDIQWIDLVVVDDRRSLGQESDISAWGYLRCRK